MRYILPILIALLLTAALLLLRGRLERARLSFPTSLSGDEPARWGLPCETLSIPTPDGEALGAWWCPRPQDDGPVLLFLHGNAGTRADRLHNVQGLWQAGWPVLIIDYRGYGESTGTPGEAGLIADGLAAFDWLAARRPAAPIAVFGRSLGGAVAAQVALRRPLAGLVLESTFTSVPDMAALTLPLPGIRHLVRTRLDAHAALARVQVPLLVIHGTADELVPPAMGEALFRAAASADKRLLAVRGGTHNDTYLVAGADYWRWLGEFRDLCRRPAPHHS